MKVWYVLKSRLSGSLASWQPLYAHLAVRMGKRSCWKETVPSVDSGVCVSGGSSTTTFCVPSGSLTTASWLSIQSIKCWISASDNCGPPMGILPETISSIIVLPCALPEINTGPASPPFMKVWCVLKSKFFGPPATWHPAYAHFAVRIGKRFCSNNASVLTISLTPSEGGCAASDGILSGNKKIPRPASHPNTQNNNPTVSQKNLCTFIIIITTSLMSFK